MSVIVAGSFLAGCKSTFSRNASVESLGQSGANAGIMMPSFERPFGRYLGFLRLSDESKMAVVMDVVPEIPSAKPGSMRAIMRVHLGGFASPEFTSFYFPRVETGFGGTLSFAGVEDVRQDVSLEDGRLGDGRFSARLVLTSGETSRTGFVEARRYGPGEVGIEDILAIGGSVPAIGVLSGEYVASCDGHQSSLQLEFSRWNRSLVTGASGFWPGAVLTGRLGVAALDSCDDKSPRCVQKIFRAGTFDPFSGQLSLQSSTGDTTCHVNGSAVNCDSCSFSRARPLLAVQEQRPLFHARAEETVFDPGAPVDMETQPGRMDGSFYGYLHHESANGYQPFSLSLKYGADTSAYSAVSALYFGPATGNEFVAYRFDPVPARLFAGRVLLDGPGEAFLIVTATGEKGLSGLWYSKTHGRIGTVSLVRDNMPPLMVDGKLLVPGLGGNYSGDHWQLDIKVASNVSEHQQEFYPLRMFGDARERGDSRKRRLIQDGTFDFYTGVVSLRLDDGRIIVGKVAEKGLELFWPPWPRLGPVIDTQIVHSFTRIDPADRKIAARK